MWDSAAMIRYKPVKHAAVHFLVSQVGVCQIYFFVESNSRQKLAFLRVMMLDEVN